MVELRVAVGYIRCYRDYLGKWVTRIGIIKAIASSASIAAWAIWKEYAFVWGIHRGFAGDRCLERCVSSNETVQGCERACRPLDSLFIDAQLEWENVNSDIYSDAQINTRLHKLRKLHQEAELRSFKEGLPVRQDLFQNAEAEAAAFFISTYGVTLLGGGTDVKPK